MSNEAGVEAAKKPPDHGKQIVIEIDRKPYTVEEKKMSGAELRRLPEPDIGADFDLWLEVPGSEDRKIADDEEVRLKKGMQFFTAPRVINPGAPC